MAGLSDAIVVCDGTGRIVDANPALERHLGIKPLDAIGKSVAQAFARWPVLIDACAGKCGRCELELPAPRETENETDDGSPRFLDVEVTALRDRRGHDLGRALVLRDVTDRQRALRDRARETEGALRDIQQRFRAIIDHTFELIGLLDPQGHLLIANRTALDFAGIDDRAARALVDAADLGDALVGSVRRVARAAARRGRGRGAGNVRALRGDAGASQRRAAIDRLLAEAGARNARQRPRRDGPGPGGAAHRRGTRRHRAPARRTGERGARGATASRATARSDRPARRRRRTRLQQPDHRDPRQRRGDPPDAAGRSTIRKARST